jgi:hypothetical protein
MPTDNGPIVNNHDVSGIVRRINRFIVEARDCQSNAQARISDADLVRLKTYHGSIISYISWTAAQPQLDMPESSPRTIMLDASPTVPLIENDDLVDLINLYVAAREEIVNSQSARMSSSLLGFDRKRCEDLIKKADDFLVSYVAKVSPLDLPESSPMRDQSGPGRTGT